MVIKGNIRFLLFMLVEFNELFVRKKFKGLFYGGRYVVLYKVGFIKVFGVIEFVFVIEVFLIVSLIGWYEFRFDSSL